MDKETRNRVQNAETKRLYREALKKKLQTTQTNDLNLVDEEEIKLPSFAFVNRLGLIECSICGESFGSKIEFIGHLNRSKHTNAIEKLKMQVQMTPEQPAPELMSLLEKRDIPQIWEIQDPNEEKEQDPNYFLEKNQISLPSGFFDDQEDAEEFMKAESVRMKRLLKAEGKDTTYVNIQDKRAIDDIRNQLLDLDEKAQAVVSMAEENEPKTDRVNLGRQLIDQESVDEISRVQSKLDRLKALREKKKNGGK